MKRFLIPLIISAAVTSPISYASLTLTAAGVDAGFTLSTFVSGYNFGSGYGPLAQGIASDGKVITGSSGDRKIYVFNDTDGQTLGSAVANKPYACQTSNCNWVMANAGGKIYGAQLLGGTFSIFASDGTFSEMTSLSALGLRGYAGMWGNPVNGHIIASSNVGLVDIDPINGSYRTIAANLFPDGVTLSSDGETAYVENRGNIQSYSVATGTLLHTFITGHSPDGTGVISGGSLDGMVVVNNNDGTVGLLDPSKANGDPLQFTIIASGGTRGDFVSADINNGTLFLSQNERVDRLTCGAGCSFSAPLPQTYFLMTAGLLVIRLFSRTRSLNPTAL